MLFTVTLLAVRNQRILAAWNARQKENERRVTARLPAFRKLDAVAVLTARLLPAPRTGQQTG